MTMDIDLSEVAGLARIIDAAPEQAFKAANVATAAIAEKVKRAAIAAAPEDTGTLKQSIKRRTWKFKGDTHADVFTIPDGRGFNVGFYVEYGTSKMPPRPFLSSQMTWAAPAFEAAVIAGIDPLGSA